MELPTVDAALPRGVCRPRTALLLAAVLVLGAIGGCDFPAEQQGRGEGPGRRAQVLALSPQQELELGRQAYREILSNPERYGRVLPRSSEESKRAISIARRIVAAAGIEPLRREINLRGGYRYEWEVHVLENRQINAFCLPGGKIAVFTGLFQVVENNDQLATVLSHEIAHALAHHVSERIAREGSNRSVVATLMSRAFDRQQESEADHIGLFLMTFAGYNPAEALRFWERMRQFARSRPQIPAILSDHPTDEQRIRDLQKWVQQAAAAKRAYDQNRTEQPAEQTGLDPSADAWLVVDRAESAARRVYAKRWDAITFPFRFEEILR